MLKGSKCIKWYKKISNSGLDNQPKWQKSWLFLYFMYSHTLAIFEKNDIIASVSASFLAIAKKAATSRCRKAKRICRRQASRRMHAGDNSVAPSNESCFTGKAL